MHALEVRIGNQGSHINLRQLQKLAQRLQSALSAVAAEKGDMEPPPQYEIVSASVGSLHLGIALSDNSPRAEVIFHQFIDDLAGLSQGQLRPTMPSYTLAEYRKLLKIVEADTPIECVYGETRARLDEQVRRNLEEQISRTKATGVELRGAIESINIHSRPYTCALYTHFEPRQRIACEFDADLLPAITDALERQKAVKLVGDAEYGPVGVYPVRFIIRQPPVPIAVNLDYLRAAVRSMSIVPEGVSIPDYLASIRDENDAEI